MVYTIVGSIIGGGGWRWRWLSLAIVLRKVSIGPEVVRDLEAIRDSEVSEGRESRSGNRIDP